MKGTNIDKQRETLQRTFKKSEQSETKEFIYILQKKNFSHVIDNQKIVIRLHK